MIVMQRWLALLVLGVTTGLGAQQAPSPQGTLRDEDRARIPREVQSWRAVTIPPLARFDWCRVPTMFHANGVVMGGEYVEQSLLARTAAECAQRDAALRAGKPDVVPSGTVYVRVDAMHIYPDSVVVKTTVKRSNTGGSVAEDYVLAWNGPGKVLGVKLLRIWLIVSD